MPVEDWTPTLPTVGAILRARTRNRNGVEEGTFTASTRPTDVQALELVGRAVEQIAKLTGDELPVEHHDSAANVAALGAALLIELSYFPEQINTGRSPYPQLKELYDEELDRLLDALAEAGVDVVTDTTEGGVPSSPYYVFPEVPLVDWGTRW